MSDRPHRRVVGLYSDEFLADPKVIEELKKAVGLNLVIAGGTSRLSEETIAKLPAGDPGEGRGPGLSWSDDDSAFRETIARYRNHGLHVLAICGGWHGGATHPDLAARDVFDCPISELVGSAHALESHASTACPCNPKTNAWFEAAFSDLAAGYALDGITVSHARFQIGAHIRGLFCCACEHCESRARSYGIDFTALRRDLQELHRVVEGPSADTPSLPALLGAGPAPDDDRYRRLRYAFEAFMDFRCRAIAENLERFRLAVRAAAPRSFCFAGDWHMPTTARWVGHDFSRLGPVSDMAMPLITHTSFFLVQTFAAWADHMVERWPGMTEAAALETCYRALDYEDLALPLRIEELGADEPGREAETTPLGAIVERELERARRMTSRSTISYPVINSRKLGQREAFHQFGRAFELGHEGVIFQGSRELLGEGTG